MKTERDISTIIFKVLVAVVLSLYVILIIGMLGWGFMTSLKSDFNHNSFLT